MPLIRQPKLRNGLMTADMSAVHCQWAVDAIGFSGGADLSAEKYDSVAEIAAFFRGQNGPQLLFHLLRLFALGKTQAAADPDTVGITDHTAGNAIKITKKQIGSFSAYTGNSQ